MKSSLTCISPVTMLILAGGLMAGEAIPAKPKPGKPDIPPMEGWVPPEIHCPFGTAPVLDGEITAGEWDDALFIRKANDPWPHDTQEQKLKVTYAAADLGVVIRMKHDGTRLYILTEVTDDILYNLDTPEWVPANITNRGKPIWKSPPGQEDWGYWGDCFEVGLCANFNGPYKILPITGPSDPAKPGECWKVQGNISYGRIMGGDKLQEWVDSKAMQCAMKRRAKGQGYIEEWAIAFAPCLATGEGKYHQPGSKDPIGMQLNIVDIDAPEATKDHPNRLLHHQGIWPYNGRGPKKARVNWARLFLDHGPAEEKSL